MRTEFLLLRPTPSSAAAFGFGLCVWFEAVMASSWSATLLLLSTFRSLGMSRGELRSLNSDDVGRFCRSTLGSPPG